MVIVVAIADSFQRRRKPRYRNVAEEIIAEIRKQDAASQQRIAAKKLRWNDGDL